MQIDVQRVIHNRFPSFQRRPQAIQQGSIYALRRLIRESEINDFMTQHQHAKGMEFVESVLDHFNLSYRVSDRSRRNIPATGRVVIVANHPLGALDGLTLLKMVGDVRKDVKILANNLLSNISNLEPLLLPVNNLSGRTSRKEIQAVHDALQREEAVIIFPAGEVSRAKFGMVRDGDWHSSFLGFARKSGAPVLPVRVKAKNSPLFYQISTTVTFPAAPDLGDEIRIIDGTGSAATNNIIINRNGNKIQGATDNFTIDVNRAAVGFVYYNAAQGWILIEN